MTIKGDVILDKESLYDLGRENGLTGSTLDGFAMLLKDVKIEINFDEENIEIINKKML